MERSGGERRGGTLSYDASCEGRKIEVQINIIITYDILPPPRALLVRNTRHVRVDGGMIVGGGAVLWGGCRSCSTDDAQIR